MKNIMKIALLIEVGLIASISIATIFEGVLFSVFYNLLYGLIFSMIVPIYFIVVNNENFKSVGIKRVGLREIIVLIIFVAFSVGGQLIPLFIKGQSLSWNLLLIGFIPLIMTTFFEEFLFRGFIQSRVEKNMGTVAAILISALMFSLYHLGYPGFRTIEDILLLFAVGLMFSVAYKLSNNNLIIVYFVNLPNALITYMLKYNQFPTFTKGSIVYAAITIIFIIGIYIASKKRVDKKEELNDNKSFK